MSCKHSQAKFEMVEVNGIKYKEKVCPSCGKKIRSERVVDKK